MKRKRVPASDHGARGPAEEAAAEKLTDAASQEVTRKPRVSKAARRKTTNNASESALPPAEGTAQRVEVPSSGKPPKGKKKKARRQAPDGGAPAAADAPAAAPTAVAEAPLQPTEGSADKVNTFVPDDGAYTFQPHPDDHCETDIRAYAHLKPVLQQLELAIYGRLSGQLRIWDPYYCNGQVARNLTTLGFPHTHNKNEDFYAVLESGKLPPHDVLVTSPPYSGDHIERCMRYCGRSGKPWLVLLPNWVHRKDYFEEVVRTSMSSCTMRYLGPAGVPYNYWFPKGSERPDHIHGDGKTTPYSSSWHMMFTPEVGGARLFANLDTAQRQTTEWVMAKTVKGLKWCSRKVQERKVSAKAKAAAKDMRKASVGAAAGMEGQRLGRGRGAVVKKPIWATPLGVHIEHESDSE